METTYLPDELYLKLGEAIVADKAFCNANYVDIDPTTGKRGYSEVVGYLGGILNIWPERYREKLDAALAFQLQITKKEAA